MRARLIVSLGALLCLLSPAAPAAPLRLTLVGARLDAARLPKVSAARSTAPLSDLSCLSLPGLRDMAGACGGADPSQMAARPQIDPLVRVEIGDRVVRTYPIPGTLEPRWDYGVILDSDQLRGHEAKVLLHDYIAPGDERTLGTARLRGADLLRPGERTLHVGPAELTYRVEALSAAPPRSYRFRVPGDAQMADLGRKAQREGEGYVLIPVAEGEIVEVSAAGQVRPNARRHPDRVAGPGGVPTLVEKIQFNQPGFRGCPGCNHAALIGQLGLSGLVIGPRRSFTAESSGYLLLGVNDLKVSDNDGGFDVSVQVSLPREAAGGMTRGSDRDAPPAAMAARVVQQTVDAHGSELDACGAAEPDPYGEVVLLFSISADGRPLGVVVEKASPNLRRAGECMRKKALQWRFPPPRGVVTARYPISFSPS